MPIRVLTLVDHDLPGIEPGGAQRSVQNVADRLGGDLDVSVAGTLGDGDRRFVRTLRAHVARVPHDVLYLHGLSQRAVLVPLAMRRAGLLPSTPVVIAPRGALAAAAGTGRASALDDHSAVRRARARAFVQLVRASGLTDDVLWHAMTPYECDDIVRLFGTSVRVRVAPDVPAVTPPTVPDAPMRRQKIAGEIRIGLVARVCRGSNIRAVLPIVESLRGRRVTLDVYGPITDVGYWRACERAIAMLAPHVAVRAHGNLPAAITSRVWTSHHVCLVPTDGDRFGHTLLDALSAGCPVVAGDRAPWRDLEYHGVGWDLPLDAPRRFGAALQRVTDMGDGEFREWSDRAAAFSSARRADPAALDATLALFQEATATTRVAVPAVQGAARPALAA